MSAYTYHDELWLPRPREEIFNFFAEARNLEAITPPWLTFHVYTPPPIVMRPGAIIDYRLKVHGLPLFWRTEIAEWEPPHYFVDRQVWGPYWLWHHTHRFIEKEGGTFCTDDVRYIPLGGANVHTLFVRRDVETIFAYRQKKLREIFAAKA